MNQSKFIVTTIIASLLCACQSNPNPVDSSTISSQIESTKTDNPASETSLPSTLESTTISDEHEYTVLEAIENGDQLAAQASYTTIIGYLPQAANVDENGNYFAVLLNSPTSNTPQDRIRLEGTLDFGSCKARITGTFFYTEQGEPSLRIVEAQQLAE